MRACCRFVTRLLAGALAAAAVVSCAPNGSDDSGENATSGTASTSETFTKPSPEPTTPTTTTTTRRGNPAIKVARLPVGGDASDDLTDPSRQCAHVTWIASPQGQIPGGTAVEITRVLFDPPVFEVAAGGCAGSQRPSCVHYLFRRGALECDLGVRVRGPVADDANPSVGFSGLVYCPSNSSASCRSFLAALATEQQLSVSLNVPPPPETETTTGTATETTGTATDTTSAETTDGG